jgi:3-oxoacyl-[acyl-carrier-protein] synthase II
MEPLYIESAVAISAQDSFWPERFLQDIRHTDRGWLSAVDVPYQEYINPVAIRRMSRILKISISAAMEALKRAGVQAPDAIVTGTGRGVVTEMEQFVMDLHRLKEAAMNPTLFIQSTYNSANGWIAMQSKCQGYNQTYVHRGLSFELALQDAAMLISEHEEPFCVLCGSFDEMTTDHFHIRKKIGNWRNSEVDSLRLYDTAAEGTVGGEGSAFFVLCRKPTRAVSKISGLRILHDPDGDALNESCQELLTEAGLSWSDVDLLVSGYSGDLNSKPLYTAAENASTNGGGHIFYKHLSGDFDTAVSFGLWLADHIIKTNSIHCSLKHTGDIRRHLNKIMLINNPGPEAASVILIERTDALTDK